MSESLSKQIEARIDEELRLNRYPLEIIQRQFAEEYAKELPPGQSSRLIAEILERRLKVFQTSQRDWPAITDADRLDAAIRELTDAGLQAYVNYWCCPSCAFGALSNDRKRLESLGHPPRGYFFCHEQQFENVFRHEGIIFGWGAYANDEPKTWKTLGADIRATLKRHGLKVDWDGSPTGWIGVWLDWKRRTPLPAIPNWPDNGC